MEKTSVQMEKDMLDSLDAIAKADGMNRSQVIRKACGDFIKARKEAGQ